jgi:WD40 repeat protein
MSLPSAEETTLRGSEGCFKPSVSPDGHWLTCSSYPNNALNLYDMRTGRIEPLTDKPVTASIWNSDSRSIYILSNDNGPWVGEVSIGGELHQQSAVKLGESNIFDRWIGLYQPGTIILIQSLVQQQLYEISIRRR